MKKSHDEGNKFILKFIFSIFLYVIFFIYEILEKIFNYILLHVKFIKNFIIKLKNSLYASSFYRWLKIEVDKINEKTFLFIIVFLIVSSGLMIYILPFLISNGFLKLLSIIIGKLLSTANIILNSIGIKKIFKIPFIRYLRIKINRVKKDIKLKVIKLKGVIKSYIVEIKKSPLYLKIKDSFYKFKKKLV